MIAYLDDKCRLEEVMANDPEKISSYNSLMEKLEKMESIEGHKAIKNSQR